MRGYFKRRIMHEFKFNLGDTAALNLSNETGVVIGRAEFANAEDSYLLRYRAADGRQVEAWIGDSALVPA